MDKKNNNNSAFPFFNPLSFWHLLKLTVSLLVWQMALFSPSVRIPRYDDYVISRRVGLIRLRVGPLNFHYLKGEEIFLDFQRSSKKSLTKYMNALRSVVPTLQMSTCWSCWMKRCLFFRANLTLFLHLMWKAGWILPVVKSGGGLTESCSLSAFSVEAGVYVLEGPNTAFGIFMQVSKVTYTVTLLLLCNMFIVYSPYINALHDLLFNSDFVLKSEHNPSWTEYRLSLSCDRGDTRMRFILCFVVLFMMTGGSTFLLKCHKCMPI